MSRTVRKIDHINYAIETGQSRQTGFDDIAFVHQSLPNISIKDVNLHSKIGELQLSSPIFINAMTGGGGEQTFKINQGLAIAAKETGIAMALGSQMSAIKNPEEKYTYDIVRKENPNGFIFANLGSEATIEQAQKAIDMVSANALQIHLNVVQELTMPEGDRDFKNALKRIEAIKQAVQVPIIVKEVGFGMSKESVKQLSSIGVDAIDVGGFGGTNFAKIENERRRRLLSYFNDWGVSTASSIAEAASVDPNITILGSGGIQSSADIAKALAMGASATGLAGYFLKIFLQNGVEDLIQEINSIHEDLVFMFTALGAKNINELQLIPVVISGYTHHWLNERGIDTTLFSQRS